MNKSFSAYLKEALEKQDSKKPKVSKSAEVQLGLGAYFFMPKIKEVIIP